jgi:hypothetical protein
MRNNTYSLMKQPTGLRRLHDSYGNDYLPSQIHLIVHKLGFLVIGLQNHDERSHYNVSVELDDVEILRTTQILGMDKTVFSTKVGP